MPEVSTSCPSSVGCQTEHPVRSFADLLFHLAIWPEPSDTVREVLKSYIRTAGFIVVSSQARDGSQPSRVKRAGVSLANIPCDVGLLNKHLFTYPAAVHGLTHVTYSKSIGGLRRILRHLDLIDPRSPPPLPEGSPWERLIKTLSDRPFLSMPLKGFAAWCDANAISPETVTQESLTAFEWYLKTRHLNRNVAGLLRALRKAWRQILPILPPSYGAPRLRESPNRYTLPFTAFPESFQSDVKALEARLSGANRKGPFRGEGPRRPLRARSIKMRVYSIRQAATALVARGRDPATILQLADLVEEQAFETILEFFWHRAMVARRTDEDQTSTAAQDPIQGVTAQTGLIASALMMVARYHCGLNEAKLAPLITMASDLTPKAQNQLSRKNRDRLRQFDDPLTRAKMLHLPKHLMEIADAERVRPHRAAYIARTAVAIELLLHIPFRLGNLVGLRLGRHLKVGDTRRGLITSISLRPEETKNSADLEWWVSPELGEFIDKYFSRYRPTLAAPGSDWLFPAGDGKEGPITQCAMAQSLTKTVAEKVGAIINPHLFRSLCARMILEHTPGALEDVRLMLGNKTLEVILAHYSPVERATAGRRADQVLRQGRIETTAFEIPFAKPRKKRLA